MYLHQNKELFAELLTLTAESSIYSEEIIEKDYYELRILRNQIIYSKYP